MSKKNQKKLGSALAVEIEKWESILLDDLRERVEKNGGKPLSQRQLHKTTNGDCTYDRLLRVIGRGDKARLEQVMRSFCAPLELKTVLKVEGECVMDEATGTKSAALQKENVAMDSGKVLEEVICTQPVQKKRRKWSREELLELLWQKFQELGRMPKQTEIVAWSRDGLCPSYPTWMKILGVNSKAEWEQILEKKD